VLTAITRGIARKGSQSWAIGAGGSGGDAMMMQIRQRDDRVWNEGMM